jgi:hypothetical protein
MKRLLAVVAGALGLTALWKRRSSRPVEPSPANDLRAKLAESKANEEPEPPEPETVDDRRADAHAKARQAIDELGES